MNRFLFTGLVALMLMITACRQPEKRTTGSVVHTGLAWQPFTKAVFDEARQKDKLVLLDIGANWCHWCHVMDDSTYAHPDVQDFLNAHFVLAREDQDLRADLFAKYRDYG